MGLLDRKTAVVTGANSGIGLATEKVSIKNRATASARPRAARAAAAMGRANQAGTLVNR